jgi:hypothetical protein
MDSIFSGANAEAQADVFVKSGGGGTAKASAAATAMVKRGQPTVSAKTLAVAAAKDWESTGIVMAKGAAVAQATNSDVFAKAVVGGLLHLLWMILQCTAPSCYVHIICTLC